VRRGLVALGVRPRRERASPTLDFGFCPHYGPVRRDGVIPRRHACNPEATTGVNEETGCSSGGFGRPPWDGAPLAGSPLTLQLCCLAAVLRRAELGRGTDFMSETGTPAKPMLRAALVVDAVVFLIAALLNFVIRIPLGFAELNFPVPIWQAGIGEAVIGLALLAAAARGRGALSWVAFWLSVAGIAFGLSSPRVQGPARDIHIILVPLAVIIFCLLLWQRQQRRRLHSATLGSGAEK
jgi:hypothetical protein